MPADPEPWRVVFYTDSQGRCDVRDYIDQRQPEEKAQIALYFRLLKEHGTLLGTPYVRFLQDGLWELRPGANRFFYAAVSGRKFVVLVACRKSGQKARPQFVKLALKRLGEYEERIQ